MLQVRVLRKINLVKNVNAGSDNIAYYDEPETDSTKF